MAGNGVIKGVSPLRAVLRHALPNAVGPIANAVSLSLSYLFGGVIIIETIFSYPAWPASWSMP